MCAKYAARPAATNTARGIAAPSQGPLPGPQSVTGRCAHPTLISPTSTAVSGSAGIQYSTDSATNHAPTLGPSSGTATGTGTWDRAVVRPSQAAALDQTCSRRFAGF